MQIRDHFAMLARFHVWAGDKLLDQVASIPDRHYRQDCGLFFKSIHGTLNHMLVGELNWYARFSEGVSTKFQLNDEVESDRFALTLALREAAIRWTAWIDSLPAEGRDEELRYTRISGDSFSLPYCGMLAHVFNHGTHHRGQITAAMTALGYPCPELDLIYMLLEEKNRSL